MREVSRLAEDGVELPDILLALEVPDAVRRDRALMKRVTRAVEVGHAKHRVAIAQRMAREGIKRGRAHALLALGRNRLKFDVHTRDAGPSMFEAMGDMGERLAAILSRLAAERAPQPVPTTTEERNEPDAT